MTNTDLRSHLNHLTIPLHPLRSITTGARHPSFPRTLLHYHLLTEPELDSLASFYHQRTPTTHSFSYPAPVIFRWERHGSIDGKRRRFGRFVGLKGCNSPGMGEEWKMEKEMEAYVTERIRAGFEREVERERLLGKGCW